MTKRPAILDLALAGNLHLLEKVSVLPADFNKAACIGADTALFFAESPKRVALAKAICAECPIRIKCLTWALDNEDYGVFGGMTASERLKYEKIAKRIDDSLLRKMQEQYKLIVSPDISQATQVFGVNKRTIYRWRELLQTQTQTAH